MNPYLRASIICGTTDQNYSKDYGSAGNRTVTITAADESVMTHFRMDQSGADISFALADLPSGLTYFLCTGSNTVTKGAIRTWKSTMDRVYLASSASTGGLSDKDVDDLLNELADVTTWTGTKNVTITTNQGKRSIFSDTAATALTAALGTFATNGRIDDIDSGTLTAGTLYRIGKTEVNHFGTGLVVGDYFVSDGTETCDANNTVLKVFAPSTSGVTVVSEKEGSTQNWLTKDAGFAYNEASYRVIVREYA